MNSACGRRLGGWPLNSLLTATRAAPADPKAVTLPHDLAR